MADELVVFHRDTLQKNKIKKNCLKGATGNPFTCLLTFHDDSLLKGSASIQPEK